jgi:hypothetical protein
MNADLQYMRKHFSEIETSELLSKHSSGTLTDMGYRTLEEELNRRGIAIPARPPQPENVQSSENAFLSYWYGRKPLWKAYWVVGKLGITAVFMASLLIVAALTYTLFPQYDKSVTPLFLFVIPLTFVYSSFAMVSIWRCARNTSQLVWALLARMVVVIYVGAFVFGIVRAAIS